MKSNEKDINGSGLKDIIKNGNVLVLALEDMIESLDNFHKDQRNNSFYNQSGKTLSLSDLKVKTLTIKNLFRDFQDILTASEGSDLRTLETDIVGFKHSGDNYMDEVLADWFLLSEGNKAIDHTHDICYKLRELIRKIEKQ